MTGSDLKTLRTKTSTTLEAMATILTVTSRTLSKWEAEDEPIARPYVLAVRDRFVDSTLGPLLRSITQEVFRIAPSERINLWLVRDWVAILHSNTSRRQCLRPRSERDRCTWIHGECSDDYCFHNPKISRPLGGELSLTTLPLRTGETLNLAGRHITDHPAKLFPTRNNEFLASGRCESLLHAPCLIPSDRGPRPVALLDLENRLDPDGSGSWGVRLPVPEDCEPGIVYGPEELSRARAGHFTAEDERRVKDLLSGHFRGDLGEFYRIFDY
jgi:hypothetical protein